MLAALGHIDHDPMVVHARSAAAHFWWIIMTSPEIFIFLFFMITDPKTVPTGRVARVVFGVAIGVVSSLLMAPWDTEFGVKVGPAVGVGGDVRRPAVHRAAVPGAGVGRRPPRCVGAGAGGRVGPTAPPAPARGRPRRRGDRRGPRRGRQRRRRRSAEHRRGVGRARGGPAGRPGGGSPADVDPASLPTVSIDRPIAALSASLATPAGAQDLAATLAWNLSVEAEAVRTGDASLLPAITDGQRLLDVTGQIDAAGPGGERTVAEYTFATLHLEIVYPGGFQRGANAGLVATGTVVETVYRPDGSVVGTSQRPFATDVLAPPDDQRPVAHHRHARSRGVTGPCGGAP